ncbi:MAG: RecQ family ATP-dependent DNA helicase [Isosphaeraceae bacterium]
MSVSDPPKIDLERTLRDRFGLERFRPGQREVIESVLAGGDVLCVMPTGGGKSLCYQLPALVLEGMTLVVSPLIALMKDQVDALHVRGLRATLINSTLDPTEQRSRLLEIEAGEYDLVYVAPERFRSARFLEAMAKIRPGLLAVDEAHCISEWGHDFRPDYARLGRARVALGNPPCIALTATATDIVRRDIAEQLNLRSPAQFVTGFDRPNLSYRVVAARRDLDKLVALESALNGFEGSAIIYASSRRRCEEVAGHVARELKKKVVVYHAGLDRDQRHEAQETFMNGRADVVVATNAFGMGVDKSDIRAVIHFNIPGTLEAYYQEAGRAGRDGLPAACVLLFAPGDRFLQEMFIENEYPPPEVVYRAYDFLRGLDADPIELTHSEIKEAARIDLSDGAVGSALRLIEGAGGIERFQPRENQAIIRFNLDPDEGSLEGRLGPQAHVQRMVLLAFEGLCRGRYGEPVYFQPDEFAARIGLDRAALVRAIRGLTADLPIDYLPPFRGQAIRILDRARKARDLPIDFRRLEQRKRQEYEKLDRMFQFAQSKTCRRAYLLQYFGERGVVRCGRCDRCEGDGAPADSDFVIESAEARELVLKVLSGVARARGRVGKTTIAQMLLGSASERLERLGLKGLSTYGILAGRGWSRHDLHGLLDALTTAGLIETKDPGGGNGPSKPVAAISSLGMEWLRTRGAEPLSLSVPDDLKARLARLDGKSDDAATSDDPPNRRPIGKPEPGGSALIGPSGHADPLFDHLRGLRLQWAREAGVRAFHIFPDRVLDVLVQERPSSPSALASIKGVGPSTMDRYGQAILDAIAHHRRGEHAGPSDSDDLAIESIVPNPDPPGVVTPEHTPLADEPQSRSSPTSVRVGRSVLSELVHTAGRAEAHEDARKPPAEPTELPRTASDAPPTPRFGAYVRTEEWTWRLLERGFSADEAAAIRGLERSAIVRHATWMAREGRAIPLGAFLDPARLEAWRAWKGETPPEDADAVVWALFLAARKGPPT